MNLNEKFKDFVISMRGTENIDDFPITQDSSRKADYLIHDRGIVVEVKYLTEDRSQTVNERLNQLANSDPNFPQFFGTVHVEEIIRKHQNSEHFRKWICNFAARTLDAIIRSANRQIRDTQLTFNLNRSIGLLVLLNDGIQIYDDKFIQQEVYRILNKHKNGTLDRPHVEAVWYINERNDASKSKSSTMLIGPAARNSHITTILDSLQLRWVSHNGYAMQRKTT